MIDRSRSSSSSLNSSRSDAPPNGIGKSPTGIAGFDLITAGGLPRGRPTLVCGGPGCGKSLFAMEFLVRGATQYDEPGVFVSFEESPRDLAENFASLGFDIERLVSDHRLVIDHVILDPNEIEETGEWDLEGLFVRVGLALEAVGARRVVLDTIETLFGALRDERTLRSELVRLFRWLKDRGVTAVITAEKGTGSLTRHGLEEYVSDCVVFLDHRVDEQLSTRRLRIVKYRGTEHGTNEYPFAISAEGFRVLPITSLGLTHDARDERIETGHAGIDQLLGGGPFRGSSVLISGSPGSGKTTFASQMVAAAARRGEQSLFFSFEESPAQIRRNLRSVGIELDGANGLIEFVALRPQLHGIEAHLIDMQARIESSSAALVVLDPMTALTGAGSAPHTQALVLRIMDVLKMRGATGLFLSLEADMMNVQVSSMMDTWIRLREIEHDGERTRLFEVIKSRGSAHSRRGTPFRITDRGFELLEPATGRKD